MQIKDSHNSVRFLKIILAYKSTKAFLLYVIFPIILFSSGYLFHRARLQDPILDYLSNGLKYAKNYIISYSVDIDRVYIEISHLNYQKIAHQRDIGLKIGNNYRTHPFNEGYVPIVLKTDFLELRAKARLKGGTASHWGDMMKWSFKIKIDDDNTYKGMKYFSLQHPKTRTYLNEWFFHRFLAYNGLIALRYDFVELILNGESYGVYAIEENMDGRLIEHNSLREGVLINFDTDIMWDRPIMFRDDDLKYFYGSNINAYGKDIKTDSVSLKNFSTAKNLLSLFRTNRLRTSKVFNTKELALFFAIVDLFGGHHASALYNMKFYYNPITSKLHPVGYDNQQILNLGDYRFLKFRGRIQYDILTGLGKQLLWNDNERFDSSPDWYDLVFSDPEFYKEYISALKEVSDQSFIEEFFNVHSTESNKVTSVLHRSFPNYDFDFYREILFKNAKYIRDYLNPGKTVQSYFLSFNKMEHKVRLDIANLYHSPVEILSLSDGNNCSYQPDEMTVLQAMGIEKPVEYNIIDFVHPNIDNECAFIADDFVITYKLYGGDMIFSDKIINWDRIDQYYLNTNLLKQSATDTNYSFIYVDSINQIIEMKKGQWTLDNDFIIPKNYPFYVLPGTEIDLINNAKIISYSTVYFLGNDESNIKLHSSDKTGQGLTVIEAEKTSVIRNTKFINLSNIQDLLYSNTGAITFYESPVDIDNSTFSNNIEGDDYLNLIRTEVSITSSYFENIYADAIDGDFITGTITDTYFNNVGNDCIDISGSVMKVDYVMMDNVGDKGISIGENSTLTGNYITIKNAEIGVTSKDLSKVNINQVKISDSTIGYTVYNKKSEFGPGKLSVNSSSLQNVEIPYLIEEESTFNINGINYQSTSTKVKDLLYGVKYGKGSK